MKRGRQRMCSSAFVRFGLAPFGPARNAAGWRQDFRFLSKPGLLKPFQAFPFSGAINHYRCKSLGKLSKVRIGPRKATRTTTSCQSWGRPSTSTSPPPCCESQLGHGGVEAPRAHADHGKESWRLMGPGWCAGGAKGAYLHSCASTC